MEYKSIDVVKRYYFPKIVLEERIQSGARILDIGCGPGYFLQECDKYGLETYGVDKDCKILEEATKRTKAKLYCHDIEQELPMFKDNFFDLVVMLDVIEHLKCPYIVLREIHRVLKPDGKLVLTTPNLNAVSRFIMKRRFHGYKDETHLYLFTPASIEFLLERAGFAILKIETPLSLIKLHYGNRLIRALASIFDIVKIGGEILCIGLKRDM